MSWSICCFLSARSDQDEVMNAMSQYNVLWDDAMSTKLWQTFRNLKYFWSKKKFYHWLYQMMFNNYNWGKGASARSKSVYLIRMDMLICSSIQIIPEILTEINIITHFSFLLFSMTYFYIAKGQIYKNITFKNLIFSLKTMQFGLLW